jgi:hypothetical protein
MEKEMKYVMILLAGLFLTSAYAKERMDNKAAEEKLVCVTNAELDKTMKEKGYGVLLTMRNDNKIVETIWVTGQSITITAGVPNEDKSCLLAMMDDVTFNPTAIEQIYEIYKKQTKQKDI